MARRCLDTPHTHTHTHTQTHTPHSLKTRNTGLPSLLLRPQTPRDANGTPYCRQAFFFPCQLANPPCGPASLTHRTAGTGNRNRPAFHCIAVAVAVAVAVSFVESVDLIFSFHSFTLAVRPSPSLSRTHTSYKHTHAHISSMHARTVAAAIDWLEPIWFRRWTGPAFSLAAAIRRTRLIPGQCFRNFFFFPSASSRAHRFSSFVLSFLFFFLLISFLFPTRNGSGSNACNSNSDTMRPTAGDRMGWWIVQVPATQTVCTSR